MPKVSVYNTEGTPVGEVELREDIFGVEPQPAVVHEVVVMQLANRRRGTHDTKTRAEVSGGGRKPWRQKGTGRARHGSIRSPIWRGGGIVFGPHPRDYGYRVPRKVRRLALKAALADKVREGNVVVLDELRLPEPKTKEALRILSRFEAESGALLVGAEPDPVLKSAVANIQGVKFLPVENLNLYDLLRHPKLLITRAALARVEEVLQ
ncbi:MAG: 50S ribosomal protein L4 [Bacillota bacterium]